MTKKICIEVSDLDFEIISSAANREILPVDIWLKTTALRVAKRSKPKSTRGEDKGQPLIYFVQRGLDGPIKIGRSVNPLVRIISLRCASPETLRLLVTFPGDFDTELLLKKRFENLRISGEWFKPGSELIEYIDILQTEVSSHV